MKLDNKKRYLMISIDQIDKKIIRELIKDSKQPVKDLAKKVNLSISPVHDRIKKLEQLVIIDGYTAKINIKKIGYKLIVYMNISFIKHQEDLFEKFFNHISNLDEVIEGTFIAGDFDVLLKVMLEDMDAYHEFVLHKISQLDYISNVKSYFALRFFKGEHHMLQENSI